MKDEARIVHYDDSRMLSAARLMMDAHERSGSTESDIRRQIANLLAASGLASESDIRLEADRTDLRTGELIIEVKRRIGRRNDPDPQHIRQLDGYLKTAWEKGEPERIGILTDGKYWVLRLPSEEGKPARTEHPYSFTLHSYEEAGDWAVWLDDLTQVLPAGRISPTVDSVEEAFGFSVRAEQTLNELRRLFDRHHGMATVMVKRDLWLQLLGAALGEAVEGTEDVDGLFVRHTYLTAVAAVAVQAAFGVDIEASAASRPANLIDGTAFSQQVGMRGVIESDFFGWPAEIDGGDRWIAGLARWATRFDWADADFDIGRVLYESVISAEERKRLGEYYTPDWLAEAVVAEVVDDPLSQRVLDPACGSGTFLRAAVSAYWRAHQEAGLPPGEALAGLRRNVVGIDVHPVAVHLARVSWVTAAREAIQVADGGPESTVPVYLGDSLQLRADTRRLLDQEFVTVETDPGISGDAHVFLEFPKELVAQGDRFDELMLQAARDIDSEIDPVATLDRFKIEGDPARSVMLDTLRKMANLHLEGKNHIWAYYTRNLVRPIWLSTDDGQVDRIVGNPPWLSYNQTRSVIRVALESQARRQYKIWPKPKYVTNTDLSGLFYARCFDLYLKPGGRAAMVMPHSALAAGHYEKWRKGIWGGISADLSEDPWDLEALRPNDFFPVPACVAFASKPNDDSVSQSLSRYVLQWRGPAGGPNTRNRISLPSEDGPQSPYGRRAHEGATLFPRLLLFVHARPSEISWVQDVSEIIPARSPDENAPWKNLDPPAIQRNPIEEEYVREVHRGDTIAPFLLLPATTAVLPVSKVRDDILWPTRKTSDTDLRTATLDLTHIGERMRSRWRLMSDLWEEHKEPSNKLSLIGRIDFWRGLSNQFPLAPIRLLYATSGIPTAAVLSDSDAIIDSGLYWLSCHTLEEAHYLAAIINSEALKAIVKPLMPRGQFGPRHLHKHLWRLPIPEFDQQIAIHQALAHAGAVAASEVVDVWDRASEARRAANQAISARAARNELRSWLVESEIGRTIESLVVRLVGKEI